MKVSSIVVLFCLLTLTSIPVSPQKATPSPTPVQPEKTEQQKEQEKRVVEMLDQATSDAEALKLAQNRAIVFALAGDLYWQFDEKRARELFRMAGNDLINTNIDTDKEKKD